MVLNTELAEELEEARQNHPGAGNEIPRVAAVDLDQLDHFRLLRSNGALLEEFQKWGWDPQNPLPLYDNTPWAAVRVWVPKGQNPGLCDLVFPRTYKGSGYYVTTVSFDYGERQSATCGASSEWTITLNADGTLTAQWDITETNRTVPTVGRVECFSYAEPVTVIRGGTSADGSFEWQENYYGPNQLVKGVYDSDILKTDPEVWSNSFERNHTGGIESVTYSMSFSLMKAALDGLKPAPASRFRGACPHLLHSIAFIGIRDTIAARNYLLLVGLPVLTEQFMTLRSNLLLFHDIQQAILTNF